MQYLVLAYDYENVLDKRMNARATHLENTQKLMASGKIISACALMEEDKMVGSSVLTNFENDAEFDDWLQNEIYVKNGVWNLGEVQVVPVKVMPKN